MKLYKVNILFGVEDIELLLRVNFRKRIENIYTGNHSKALSLIPESSPQTKYGTLALLITSVMT